MHLKKASDGNWYIMRSKDKNIFLLKRVTGFTDIYIPNEMNGKRGYFMFVECGENKTKISDNERKMIYEIYHKVKE